MTSRAVKVLSHSIAHTYTLAALENPRDGMEKLLSTNEPRRRALTEKHVVDYCAWDHLYEKHENIWVSEFGWQPTGTTGNGRCNSDCNFGSIRADTGRHRHFKVLSGAADTGPTGPGIERQKDAVPQLLQQEILAAAIKHSPDTKRIYVLDVFAGYGSMRLAAKEMGLHYIGVDERDLMRGTD